MEPEFKPIECKLIAGSPHVKVPCAKCKAMIWVSKYRLFDDNECSDCAYRWRPQTRVADKPLAVDLRYHGEGGTS